MTGPSPSHSVDAFARLCRELDDPFAEPARVLAHAGLDERRFAEMVETWRGKLQGDEGDSLRAAFALAYRRGESAQASEPNEPAAAAEEPAVLPPPIAEEMALPPIDVPSFMKAAPLEARVEPASPPPAPAAQALSTETAVVDVSRLLRQALPFDARAPARDDVASVIKSAAPAAASVSTGTAAIDTTKLASAAVTQSEQPREGLSTETAEIDLSKLLRRSVPFSEAPATPITAELPTFADADRGPPPPPPVPVRGRWIRFNPQTGEPLETPYWEELPGGEKR